MPPSGFFMKREKIFGAFLCFSGKLLKVSFRVNTGTSHIGIICKFDLNFYFSFPIALNIKVFTFVA